METIQKQLKRAQELLMNLSSYINTRTDIPRMHKENIFNRRFSATLTSYSDFETVGLRLERTIAGHKKLEHSIQLEMRGRDKIPDDLQSAMRAAGQMEKEMQADFKSLYMFAKIFLDEFTTL